MSATRMSARRAMAASRPSYTTAAGSAPWAWATNSASVRWAQMRSWSMAAARKVSAAARTTRRPLARSRAASLPMVVVLPVPLTPTTRRIAGAPSTAGDGSQASASRGARRLPSSLRIACSGETSRRLRARSTRSRARRAPTSPVIRISSISSQSASLPPPKAARSLAPKPVRLFSRPASSASRSRSLRAASAFSAVQSAPQAHCWVGAGCGSGSGGAAGAAGAVAGALGATSSAPSGAPVRHSSPIRSSSASWASSAGAGTWGCWGCSSIEPPRRKKRMRVLLGRVRPSCRSGRRGPRHGGCRRWPGPRQGAG